MALNLDSYFSLHATALELRARRMELLANNLANADTPGYKARDVDFAAALKAATGATDVAPVQLATDNPRQIASNGGVADAAVGYRVPTQPSLDGNTVNADTERAAFLDNALHYQATLTFLNGHIKSLLLALGGGN